MFGLIFRKNQHVIEVNEDEFQVSEDPSHHPLERSWRIARFKGHAFKLPQASISSKRHFWTVFLFQGHLVVPLPEVQLVEDASLYHQLKKLIDPRHGKLIFDCDRI